MARISTYSFDQDPTIEDNVIGTNGTPGGANETVLFSLGAISNVILSPTLGLVPERGFPVKGANNTFKHSRISEIATTQSNIDLSSFTISYVSNNNLLISAYDGSFDLTSFVGQNYTSTQQNGRIEELVSVRENVGGLGVNATFRTNQNSIDVNLTNFVVASGSLTSTCIIGDLDVKGDIFFLTAAGVRMSVRDITGGGGSPLTLAMPNRYLSLANDVLTPNEINVNDDTNLTVRSTISNISISLIGGEILIFDPNANVRVRRLVIQNNITGGTLNTDYFLDVVSNDNGVAGTATSIEGIVGDTWSFTVTPRLAQGRRWIGTEPAAQTASGTFMTADAAEETSTLTFVGTNAALALPTLTLASTNFAVGASNVTYTVSASVDLNDHTQSPTITLTDVDQGSVIPTGWTLNSVDGVQVNTIARTATSLPQQYRLTVTGEAADGSTTSQQQDLIVNVPITRPSFTSNISSTGFVLSSPAEGLTRNLERYDTGSIVRDITEVPISGWTINDTTAQETFNINDPATTAQYTFSTTRSWNYVATGSHSPHAQTTTATLTNIRSLRYGSMVPTAGTTLADHIAGMTADENGLGDFAVWNTPSNTTIEHGTVNPSGERITVEIINNSFIYIMFDGARPDLTSIIQVGPGFNLLDSGTFTLHSAQVDGYKLYTTANRLIPGSITLDLT